MERTTFLSVFSRSRLARPGKMKMIPRFRFYLAQSRVNRNAHTSASSHTGRAGVLPLIATTEKPRRIPSIKYVYHPLKSETRLPRRDPINTQIATANSSVPDVGLICKSISRRKVVNCSYYSRLIGKKLISKSLNYWDLCTLRFWLHSCTVDCTEYWFINYR